jgi:hypothetical protein
MVVRGLSSIGTWVLWKFAIPSLVNPVSSVNRMLATHCLQRILRQAFGKTPPLNDGQKEREEWLFMRSSSDKGNSDAFSSCNSSHTGSGIFFRSSQHANFHVGSCLLIGAFCNPKPMEQRTYFHSVASEIWWMVCMMDSGVVENVLHRVDVLLQNFHWPGHARNSCLPFPEQSNRFHYKTTKWILNRMSITTPTIAAFPILVRLLSVLKHVREK